MPFTLQLRYSHLIPEAMRLPDLETLKHLVLNPDVPGWQFHEAGMEFSDGEVPASLIVIQDETLGYYLKYIVPSGTWLSLGDETRLGEVICPDDWEASAGLFVPVSTAWEVIRHFCLFGTRASQIDWIQPSEVPSTGNW